MSGTLKFIIWAILVAIFTITFMITTAVSNYKIEKKWFPFVCVNGVACFILLSMMGATLGGLIEPIYEGVIVITFGFLIIMILDYYSKIIKDPNLRFTVHMFFRVIVMVSSELIEKRLLN